MKQVAPFPTPFSLIPAIFTPFPGIPSAPPAPNSPGNLISTTLEDIPKLRLIIQNLHTQHSAVRRSMIFLTRQRAEKLISAARAELLSLGEEGGGEEEGLEIEILGERERTREAIEEMLKGLRVKAGGKKSEDFEVTLEDARKSATETSASLDASLNQNQEPQTAPVIRRRINRDIMQLIDYAVAELDAYDTRAKQIAQRYQESLDRRLAKEGQKETVPVPVLGFGEGSAPTSRRSSGAGLPAGILSNKHVRSPIDYEALKRM